MQHGDNTTGVRVDWPIGGQRQDMHQKINAGRIFMHSEAGDSGLIQRIADSFYLLTIERHHTTVTGPQATVKLLGVGAPERREGVPLCGASGTSRAILTGVNWLLLPEDERQLSRFMTEGLGLKLISRHLDHDESLPGPPQPFRDEYIDMLFWAPEVGPIRRLGDAPEPIDPIDSVLLRLNRERNPGDWRNLVDSNRSPLIRFHRSNWNRNGCLNPGLLQGMSIPVKDQPPDLMALKRKVERWLKSEGDRLNPFEHCTKTTQTAPKNLNPFWVWARPGALSWVEDGGEVWPWNA
jgi:hypothetical protein